jgi:hypothetical protein
MESELLDEPATPVFCESNFELKPGARRKPQIRAGQLIEACLNRCKPRYLFVRVLDPAMVNLPGEICPKLPPEDVRRFQHHTI